MKNVAVTAGGTSSEYVISLKSASTIMESINRELYHPYLLIIGRDGWYADLEGKKIPINKNNFTLQVDGQEISFDFVYNTIHGTPGEDGKIQGYFDLLNIPYSGCSVLASSITFNKSICKKIVSTYGITTPKSRLLMKNEKTVIDELSREFAFPCFVKPNNGGSSFGASKVDAPEALQAAIDKAFEHDTEVLIEEYIKGTELTCGVYRENGVAKALPITEVVSKNAFFDFQAKYEGASEEITPARVSDEITDQCQRLTEKIYTLLDCKGLARIDFLLRDDTLYFIEVNTTPGFSRESIIPQQIRAAGLDVKKIVNSQIRV